MWLSITAEKFQSLKATPVWLIVGVNSSFAIAGCPLLLKILSSGNKGDRSNL
ncbi:hypothetical protein H6G93_28065 [Nostoc sp. FACHB-973]|nr:hypothetical protein [Nostoc sp. FACHB-973]